VVDDKGTVRPCEELGKADLTDRFVAGGEVRGPSRNR
jgi:hypothetical protein